MSDSELPRAGERSGPILLTLALAALGAIWLVAGSVTVVPFLADERRREPIRDVWIEASRRLPETGFPTVTVVVFWLVVVVIGLAGVALAIVVGRLEGAEDGDAGRGSPGVDTSA